MQGHGAPAPVLLLGEGVLVPLSFWLLWKMFLLRVPWGLSILLAWDECLYISTKEGSAVTPLPTLSHAAL